MLNSLTVPLMLIFLDSTPHAKLLDSTPHAKLLDSTPHANIP